MRNLGIQTKTTETSFTNRIQEIKERILGTEDKLKKCIPWSKKMLNLKILQTKISSKSGTL